MFDYTDPTGGNLLQSSGALTNYRAILHAHYKNGAQHPNSAFTFLSAFSMLPEDRVDISNVPWVAFPKSVLGTDAEIDNQRTRLQDEYVEWRVERDTEDKVARIEFTTEFSEYYEAFAALGFDPLREAIREAIPGADPTVEDLFGLDFDLDKSTAEARSLRFRRFATSSNDSPVVKNPWNSERGLLCLSQHFNTLGALFNLVFRCGVPREGAAADTCNAVGNACGETRNSDPVICTASQNLARTPRALSLADPVGISIRRLGGIWKLNGRQIDINALGSNDGTWTVSRNGRRAMLDTQGGALTMGDDEIVTGTQVSRVLFVGAEVISAHDVEVPEEFRLGQEKRINQ